MLGILDFPVDLNPVEILVREYFEEYIRSASPERIGSFLTFTTGALVQQQFGFGKITIDFDNSATSVYASTLTFPTCFTNEKVFFDAIDAIIYRKKVPSIEANGDIQIIILSSRDQCLITYWYSFFCLKSFAVLILKGPVDYFCGYFKHCIRNKEAIKYLCLCFNHCNN